MEDSCVKINGQRWFYRLNACKGGNYSKGLLDFYERDSLKNELVVGLSYRDKTNKSKVYRLYTVFESFLKFVRYNMSVKEENRCFYEIIFGERNQKPRFDIDIDDMSVDGESVKDDLISAAICVLSKKNVELNIYEDILIYTSHGDDKQSYHVVFTNWFHNNNIEAKEFYLLILKEMKDEYAKWVDHAVYGKTQQFRMLGSRKMDSQRVKRFKYCWSYKGSKISHIYPEEPDPEDDMHKMVMEFEESLITFTQGCKCLPNFAPENTGIKNASTNITNNLYDDIDQSDALDALNKLAKLAGTSVTSSLFPYRFNGVNGQIILLKRIKASRCRICRRIHENENPYLLIKGPEKNIYFHCRRSPNNSGLFIGKLDPKHEEKTHTKIDDTKKLNKIWNASILEKLANVAQSSKHIKPVKKPVDNCQLKPEHEKLILDLM